MATATKQENGSAPAQPPTPVSQAQSPAAKRRAKARKQAEAIADRGERYHPVDGCEWIAVRSGGDVCVCESSPNAAGDVFLYVVLRKRGREIALPLDALDSLMDAGQL